MINDSFVTYLLSHFICRIDTKLCHEQHLEEGGRVKSLSTRRLIVIYCDSRNFAVALHIATLYVFVNRTDFFRTNGVLLAALYNDRNIAPEA